MVFKITSLQLTLRVVIATLSFRAQQSTQPEFNVKIGILTAALRLFPVKPDSERSIAKAGAVAFVVDRLYKRGDGTNSYGAPACSRLAGKCCLHLEAETVVGYVARI